MLLFILFGSDDERAPYIHTSPTIVFQQQSLPVVSGEPFQTPVEKDVFTITNKHGKKVEVQFPIGTVNYETMQNFLKEVEKYIKRYQKPRDNLKEGWRFQCTSNHPNVWAIMSAFFTTCATIPGMFINPKYAAFVTTAIVAFIQLLNYILFYPTQNMEKLDKTRVKHQREIAAHIRNFKKKEQQTLIKFLSDVFGYGQDFSAKMPDVAALINRKTHSLTKYQLWGLVPLKPEENDATRDEKEDDE